MSEKVTVKVERNILHLPAIALRGLVVFPNNLLHFEVGRDKSIAAVEWAVRNKSEVFLIAQKDMKAEDPKAEEMYQYGVVAEIKQVMRVSDDLVRILVEGKFRAKRTELDTEGSFLLASVRPAPVRPIKAEEETEAEALLAGIVLDSQHVGESLDAHQRAFGHLGLDDDFLARSDDLLELLVGAARERAPLVHDHDARADFLDFLHVVARVDDGGTICIHLLDAVENRRTALRVDRDRGFVEKDEFGLVGDAAGDVQAPEQATGELLGTGFLVVLETDEFDGLAHELPAHRAVAHV